MVDTGYNVFEIPQTSSTDFSEAMTFLEMRGIISRTGIIDSMWSVLQDRKIGKVFVCRIHGELSGVGCFYHTETPAFEHVSYVDGVDYKTAQVIAEYLPDGQKEYLISNGRHTQEYFAHLHGSNLDRTELHYTVSQDCFQPVCIGNIVELTSTNLSLLEGCEAPIDRNRIERDSTIQWYANISKGRIVATALIGPAIINADRDYGIIGIAAVYTEKPFRRQGFGRQLVSSLTENILQAGKRPAYWTTPDNAISQRLIEGLGYTSCEKVACYYLRRQASPKRFKPSCVR